MQFEPIQSASRIVAVSLALFVATLTGHGEAWGGGDVYPPRAASVLTQSSDPTGWQGIGAAQFAQAANSARAGKADAARRAYHRRDWKAALAIWSELAEDGNSEAQNVLGVMYENGEGVKQDFAKAAEWYRMAADQGFA